ncbi:hypothetical protein NBRC116593_28990 [Sulfitobacter pacificus]
MTQAYEHKGYPVGHCCYYGLGGAILKPKAIRDYVRANAGRGYMADDIEDIGRMAEPKRSVKLRELKLKFRDDLASDGARYRQLAHQIRKERNQSDLPKEAPIASCIHMAISLKFAHLYNGFAHLGQIEALLSQQGDLFG